MTETVQAAVLKAGKGSEKQVAGFFHFLVHYPKLVKSGFSLGNDAGTYYLITTGIFKLTCFTYVGYKGLFDKWFLSNEGQSWFRAYMS